MMLPYFARTRCKLRGPQSRPAGVRPSVQSLEDRLLPAISLLKSFPDINFNQALAVQGAGVTPPDTMMAVGPDTVVGAVNFSITLTDKQGGARVGPISFGQFFSPIFTLGDRFTDPYVLYDDQAGRFYLEVIEGNPGFSATSTIDFAVSKTSSPTSLSPADWSVFKINSVNEGGTQIPDFPKMGWNRDAVFLSMNQFNFFGFTHNLILTISKASLLAGGPPVIQQTVVATGDERHILIPARMHHETVGNLEYFLQSTGTGNVSATINVLTESGYLSGPGTFHTTVLTVNPYSNSPGVPGLTNNIDDRLLSADWIDNGTTQHLVGSGNVGVGELNLARWYEINAPLAGTPSLLQQGDINLGGDINTSYPSVAINSSDSIALTFVENSGTQSTSMAVTGRVATDALNTLQPPILVKAGVLPTTNTLRGGDYSATEYDPAAPANFWSANQYQLDSSGSNFDWGTQIAEYTLSMVPAAGLWTTVSPMPTARGFLASATGSDGRIYAIGGSNNVSVALSTVEVYRPGSDTWSSVANLPAGRSALAAAAGFDGRIYAFGGDDVLGNVVGTLQAYLPGSSSWSTAAAMITARSYLAGATGSDGRIYAIGGTINNTTAGAVNTVEAYTPGSGTWSSVTGMHTARMGPAAAKGPDGRIYVFGGMDGAGRVLNAVEAYSPTTHSWTIVAPMPTPRWGAAAVLGSDGRLLVLGGSTGSNSLASPTNSVEAYNPFSNTWSTLTPMPTARDFLAAALGFDGHVYAIGGFDGTNVLRTVQALTSVSGFGAAAEPVKTPGVASADAVRGSVRVAVSLSSPVPKINNIGPAAESVQKRIAATEPADLVFATEINALFDRLGFMGSCRDGP